MTLPASGYLLLGGDGGASGRSINSEFGYGNDMASYQGVYYGKAGQVYRFPVPGNSIDTNVFYSTFKITGGSQTFYSTQNFVIPVYNTMTITVQGGSGGTSGTPGLIYSPCYGAGQTTPGSSGATGGSSSFGGYVSAAGGAGGAGSQFTNNPGAAGQIVIQTFTNPAQGGSGPPSSANVTVSIGGGGGGGGGGCYTYQAIVNGYNLGCACWSNAATGANGVPGYVTVTWS